MRRLLNKVKMFKDPNKEADSGFPSLPSEVSYTELNYMTKRGFLARKISHYLCDKESGNYLFFNSLSKLSLDKKGTGDQAEFLLNLSELMLIWDRNNEDIPQKIKGDLKLSDDIQNAMLKAYDIYKDDLFSKESKEQKLTTSSEKSASTNKSSQWEVYRDVIFAATQGQFLLVSQDDLYKYRLGNIFCEGKIKEKSDIPACRTKAQDTLIQQGYSKRKIMSWILVLSEAITNTIKHAEEGRMTLIEDEEKDEVRFIIEDKGPGFPLKELPNNTLLAGYSTKNSMGQGFTLMMKMAKQVLLSTSSKGSTIILVFESSSAKEEQLNVTG